MTFPLLDTEQGTVTHWSLGAFEIFPALLHPGSPLIVTRATSENHTGTSQNAACGFGDVWVRCKLCSPLGCSGHSWHCEPVSGSWALEKPLLWGLLDRQCWGRLLQKPGWYVWVIDVMWKPREVWREHNSSGQLLWHRALPHRKPGSSTRVWAVTQFFLSYLMCSLCNKKQTGLDSGMTNLNISKYWHWNTWFKSDLYTY